MSVATQSVARLLPSVWNFGRGPSYPSGWALGLMTPQHTLDARAYYPAPQDRLALAGDKQPYWHVMDFSLGSLQSADDNILPDNNFTLLALMGNTDQLGDGFRTQFYQLVDDDSGFRMSRVGINLANILGSGQRPFVLKRPYPMPNRRTLLNRTQNLAAVANNIQIVLYGVKDYQRDGSEEEI